MTNSDLTKALQFTSAELVAFLDVAPPSMQRYALSVALPKVGADEFDIAWLMLMHMGIQLIEGRSESEPSQEVLVALGWACRPTKVTARDLNDLAVVFKRNGKTRAEALEAYRTARTFFLRRCRFH